MSEGLRWKLILGCLLVAVLEAPESALVLVEDLRGPWRGQMVVRERPPALFVEIAPRDPSPALKPLGADASVAREDHLGLDRNLPTRLAPRDVAVLLAR